MTNTKIDNLIDDYIETRMAYDEAHERSVAADRAHKGARSALVEAMLESQQQGIKLDFGLHFSIRSQFTIACNQDNEEDIKAWLHEHYGDAEEFIVPKLDKKLVTERLRNDIEGEALDEFEVPEFFNLKTHPDLSCSGWAKFSAEQRGKQ